MTELAAIITAISLWCANPAFTKEHEVLCREKLWDCLGMDKWGKKGFRFTDDVQCFKDFGVKANERVR